MKTETIFSSQLLQNPPPPLRFASFQDIGLSRICDLNRIYARIDVSIDKKPLLLWDKSHDSSMWFMFQASNNFLVRHFEREY